MILKNVSIMFHPLPDSIVVNADASPVAPAQWDKIFFTPPTKRDFTWPHFFEPRFRPIRPASIPADAQAVVVRRRHALRQALPEVCHGRAARCRRAGGNLRHGWNEK